MCRHHNAVLGCCQYAPESLELPEEATRIDSAETGGNLSAELLATQVELQRWKTAALKLLEKQPAASPCPSVSPAASTTGAQRQKRKS